MQGTKEGVRDLSPVMSFPPGVCCVAINCSIGCESCQMPATKRARERSFLCVEGGRQAADWEIEGGCCDVFGGGGYDIIGVKIWGLNYCCCFFLIKI